MLQNHELSGHGSTAQTHMLSIVNTFSCASNTLSKETHEKRRLFKSRFCLASAAVDDRRFIIVLMALPPLRKIPTTVFQEALACFPDVEEQASLCCCFIAF